MGKFEGIHMGHRALIAKVRELAQKEASCATAIMTFDPHPQHVLGDPGYKPLFTNCERAYLLAGLGLDYLLEYPFVAKTAALSPEEFCRKLFTDLQARVVVVGEGYRFGHKRAGSVDTLQKYAAMYGAKVCEIAHVSPSGDKKTKASTSTIREQLAAGDIDGATSLLGFPFFIMGEVTKGRQLGRTIDCPTMNIYPPEDKFLPAYGVYASHTVIDGKAFKSITNIGIRPTVSGKSPSVETHLLGGDYGDMYGRQICVELTRFVRPEMRFESLEALKVQIAEDINEIGQGVIV